MPRTAHRFARAFLGGAVAAVLAFGQVGVAHAAESNGGVRVMPLGDSITDGFNVPGGYRSDLWQQLVAAGYTIDFVGSLSNGPAALGDHDHEGHSGWRIEQLDANIVSWLQAPTPRTVLLTIGTNDVIQNYDLANAPARLSTLIDHIIATVPDVELFVSTIVPLPSNEAGVEAFNAAIPAIVQARVDAGHTVHVVDMHSAITAADLADGIHPNAAGYSKMAAVWYQALRSVPASLTSVTATPTPGALALHTADTPYVLAG
jgi:lysophospholipase L1-like esterase